jgi:hypothetical protein
MSDGGQVGENRVKPFHGVLACSPARARPEGARASTSLEAALLDVGFFERALSPLR